MLKIQILILSKVNIVTAEKGKIYFSANQKKLIMDLYDGEIHESDNTDISEYRKLRFERHKIALPADQFTFEQSAPGGFRTDRELGAAALLKIADSLKTIHNKYKLQLDSKIESVIKLSGNVKVKSVSSNPFVRGLFSRVQQKIKSDENSVLSSVFRMNSNGKEYDRYWVEIHKKYSLPFACIVFVLIGAPLGTMMRKGGFGMAAGISLIFFLIYWAFLIGGEKLADRGLLSPFWGIWSANIFFSIVGILLMIKSAREKVTLDLSFLKKLIPKSIRASIEQGNTDELNENS